MTWVTLLQSTDTPDEGVVAPWVETSLLGAAGTSQEARGAGPEMHLTRRQFLAGEDAPGLPARGATAAERAESRPTPLDAGGPVKAAAGLRPSEAEAASVPGPPRLGGSLLPPVSSHPLSLPHVCSLVGHVGSGLHSDLILT